MANPRQLRNCIFSLSFGTVTAALAIAFLLAVVATQPAQAQTFNVLHTFTGGQDGAIPVAGLTMDRAGNLYGTSFRGGAAGFGTVYQLKPKPSGWVFNVLYSFAGGSDGANPSSGVIFGPDGALYGTTYRGGAGYGTVFRLRPPATFCRAVSCPWGEAVLYRFEAGADGANPEGDLIFDRAGNIYGTTNDGGGSDNAGTVYELTPSGGDWRESVLHSFSFNLPDGAYPQSGVILDSAGNLYGTLPAGGFGAPGTVFELTYVAGFGWTESILYSFQGGSDGGIPYAGLIFDSSGNLYGATSSYGTGGGGTVFELTPSGSNWTYTVLYSFTGGSGPWDSLVMDQNGNLYGTTFGGGANSLGSVFKLTPTPQPPWTYTSLHDFTNGSDGAHPFSNVVFDTSGNLYGTASSGAQYGYGVVWEITP